MHCNQRIRSKRGGRIGDGTRRRFGAAALLALGLWGCGVFDWGDGKRAGTSTVTGNTFGAEAVTTRSVQGTVAGSDGRPIAGAFVRVRADSVARQADGTVAPVFVGLAVSDAQGNFEAPLGSLYGNLYLEIRSEVSGSGLAYFRKFMARTPILPKSTAASTGPVAQGPILFTLSPLGTLDFRLSLPGSRPGDTVFVGLAGGPAFRPLVAPQAPSQPLTVRIDSVPAGARTLKMLRKDIQGVLLPADSLAQAVIRPGVVTDAGDLKR